MARARLITILIASAFVTALWLAPNALAGTFTWAQPTDFSTGANHANPDHDSYGARPWTYVEGASATPSSFTKLTSFSETVAGGLTGWSDPINDNSFVAENVTSPGGTNVKAGELAVQPGAQGAATAIGWTSPFSHSQTVNVSYKVTPTPNSGCLVSPIVATLEDEHGNTLANGNTLSNGSFTATPGETIYLAVQDTSLLSYTPGCDIAVVNFFQLTASVSTGPPVTLTSPAPGAIISGGQPAFAGSASTQFGADNRVTVRVYSGSAATGTPVETLTTNRSGSGGYSVGASPALADGQYTAQAEQDDLASPHDKGFSSPVTFTVNNKPPTISLNSLGTKPLHTATPTLTGTAGTSPGDSKTVAVDVYHGSTTKGTPVRHGTGTISGNGSFSIQVTPALPDGGYTAVAVQNNGGGAGDSNAVSFAIKVHPPALTLTTPADGAHVPAAQLVFAGNAGNVLGDAPDVTVVFYRGASVKGRPVATLHVAKHGGSWSARYARRLKLGTYTVRASQQDDAGHTTLTKPHTFTLVAGPHVVGSQLTLDSQNRVSLSIACTASSGTCTGNVLALTSHQYQPDPGGPRGRIRVLFAYVTIPAGKTIVVRQKLSGDVAGALRHAAPLKVNVTAKLSNAGGRAATTSVVRVLRLGP